MWKEMRYMPCRLFMYQFGLVRCPTNYLHSSDSPCDNNITTELLFVYKTKLCLSTWTTVPIIYNFWLVLDPWIHFADFIHSSCKRSRNGWNAIIEEAGWEFMIVSFTFRMLYDHTRKIDDLGEWFKSSSWAGIYVPRINFAISTQHFHL